MRRILLINPNSSRDTTAMMTTIAQACAPVGVEVVGVTATRSPPMIVSGEMLADSAAEVVEIGVREAEKVSGIIISAFGDPGCVALAQQVRVPVVGIAESSMHEAAEGGRRFGIATTTPELVASIGLRVRELGLADLYTGIRLTQGDPMQLTADAMRLEAALRQAVTESIEIDGARAVIIGGGPLGQAALALAPAFDRPVIAPIPAAVRRLMSMVRDSAR